MKSLPLVLILAAALLGLPLAGAWFAGLPLDPILEFPPRTQRLTHPVFSWPVFAGYALFILAWVAPFVARILAEFRAQPFPRSPALEGSRPRQVESLVDSAEQEFRFPHRPHEPPEGMEYLMASPGRKSVQPLVPSLPDVASAPDRNRLARRMLLAGLASIAIFWPLAWTRLPEFALFQWHTFLPLWAGYLLVVNGLCLARAGTSLLTRRPRFFLSLFPLSAVFWWFFEYLNRFVQNWRYTTESFTPLAYLLLATASFSIVLPAVLSTRELLASSVLLDRAFRSFAPLRFSRPRRIAALVLLASAAGLAQIGVRPDWFYPLLWVSPLLILVSAQALTGRPHVFSGLPGGDWRLVVTSALAALVCGLFWELWNWHSLARWTYTVPFVERFHLFEMPLLGYAGYLPFGLECAAIGLGSGLGEEKR